jgi:hypothetical protein
MKYISLILIILLVTFDSFSAVTGKGRGSMGLSLDQSRINAGLEGTYQAKVQSSNNEIAAFLDFQKVFNDGRVAPVTGHNYQYNSKYVNALVDHKYQTTNPYLSWSSTAQYYYDAQTQNTIPQSWAVLTGPQYIKRIRPDITLDIQLQKATQLENQNLSNEASGVVRLSKDINSNSTFSGEFERYCTDYDDNEIVDSCSNETSAEVAMARGATTSRIRLGRFVVHEKIYPTYEIDFDHKLNTSNSLMLRYGKKNDSIKNNVLARTDSLLPDPATFTTTLTGSYLYDFKRTRVLMEVKSSETESESERIQQQRYSTQADYRLAADHCKGCLLHVSFDRDNNEISNWHSTSLGIDIPWIREFYNQFALRYTNSDSAGSFYSLIWIVNYNGRPSILSR